MKKQQKLSGYAAMEPDFHKLIGSDLKLEEFIKIEALLSLLQEAKPSANPYDAFLLVSLYGLIGINGENSSSLIHKIQQAISSGNRLAKYRSKLTWETALNKYCAVEYEKYRLFNIEEAGGEIIITKRSDEKCYKNCSFETRKKDWENFWDDTVKASEVLPYAEMDKEYSFYKTIENETNFPYQKFYVSFKGKLAQVSTEKKKSLTTEAVTSADAKGKDVSRKNVKNNRQRIISVPLKELYKCAEEIREIDEENSKGNKYSDYKFDFKKVLQNATFRDTKTLAVTDNIKIDNVCNMVGMVGVGKTALLILLAYWFAQKGRRMAIIVSTADETLKIAKRLSELGIKSAPLVSARPEKRLVYIKRLLKDRDGLFLPPYYSQYLTPSCILNSLAESDNKKGQSKYILGEEPCTELESDRKKYLCPFFEKCPGTKMLRDAAIADIVVATPESFAKTSVKTPQGKKLFLEHAIDNFDLVVFDECDSMQQRLDRAFQNEFNFNKHVSESVSPYNKLTKISSDAQTYEDKNDVDYYETSSKSPAILNSIIASLELDDIREWEQTRSFFTARMLLKNISEGFEDKFDTYAFKFAAEQLEYLMLNAGDEKRDGDEEAKNKDGENLNAKNSLVYLRQAMQASCNNSVTCTGLESSFNIWCKKIGDKILFSCLQMESPFKEQAIKSLKNRIKLILKVIYFEQCHMIELEKAARNSMASREGQADNKLAFMNIDSQKQRTILPLAPQGNLFGLLYRNNKLYVLKQLALGRILMTSLPYLKTDKEGNPIAPRVLMMSGSSWIPGSYSYNIERPVNYIIEADTEKVSFLKNTRFYAPEGIAVETDYRVSGYKGAERKKHLENVINLHAEKMIEELERSHEMKSGDEQKGKILLVTGSYENARDVARYLEDAFKKYNKDVHTYGLLYLVPDDEEESENYYSFRLKRDDVNGNKTLQRSELAAFAGSEARIIICPAKAIERGHNIVDETGHAVLTAVFFLVRPMSNPADMEQKITSINGFAEQTCKKRPGETLLDFAKRFRKAGLKRWNKICFENADNRIPDDEMERKDITASLFALILQIFGRLARVSSSDKLYPHVYFADGAFKGYKRKDGKPSKSYDTIDALSEYLKNLLSDEKSKSIAEALYGVFARAYLKDLGNSLKAGSDK